MSDLRMNDLRMNDRRMNHLTGVIADDIPFFTLLCFALHCIAWLGLALPVSMPESVPV